MDKERLGILDHKIDAWKNWWESDYRGNFALVYITLSDNDDASGVEKRNASVLQGSPRVGQDHVCAIIADFLMSTSNEMCGGFLVHTMKHRKPAVVQTI